MMQAVHFGEERDECPECVAIASELRPGESRECRCGAILERARTVGPHAHRHNAAREMAAMARWPNISGMPLEPSARGSDGDDGALEGFTAEQQRRLASIGRQRIAAMWACGNPNGIRYAKAIVMAFYERGPKLQGDASTHTAIAKALARPAEVAACRKAVAPDVRQRHNGKSETQIRERIEMEALVAVGGYISKCAKTAYETDQWSEPVALDPAKGESTTERIVAAWEALRGKITGTAAPQIAKPLPDAPEDDPAYKPGAALSKRLRRVLGL